MLIFVNGCFLLCFASDKKMAPQYILPRGFEIRVPPGTDGSLLLLFRSCFYSADQLLAAYEDRASGEFDAMVGALVAAGRDDVLDLAVRKVRARQSDENAAELWVDMLAVAGGAAVGPSGWAELVALPVALLPGGVPDAMALVDVRRRML
jgi:hypothetical protein